jgi:hypothetical protein
MTTPTDITSTDIAIIITGIGTALSAIAAIAAIIVTYRVHISQKLLAQRQLLLPLWDYISQLREINPQDPITPDVIKLVNTLELVALCCEGGLVDEQVIRRTFKEAFILHYLAIRKCGTLPGMNVNGEQLLMQNRAASTFFDNLYKDYISQGKITGQP